MSDPHEHEAETETDEETKAVPECGEEISEQNQSDDANDGMALTNTSLKSCFLGTFSAV
jgi:hypothetical protein